MLATISTIDAFRTGASPWWAFQIALWLWSTVLFANFAESIAEGRGKAAADALRAAARRHQGQADRRPEKTGTIVPTPAYKLAAGAGGAGGGRRHHSPPTARSSKASPR